MDRRLGNAAKDPNDDPLEDLNDARVIILAETRKTSGDYNFRKGRRIGSSRWKTSRRRLYRLSNASWRRESIWQWLKVRKLKFFKTKQILLVDETEILNADEKNFKHELLTMFVDELKGAVQKINRGQDKPSY